MKKRNYFLIGTNSAGNNAFFLKKNYFNKANKLVVEKRIFNSKFRESRDIKGNLSFLDKKESLELIKNNFIKDLKNNKKKRIFELNLLN